MVQQNYFHICKASKILDLSAKSFFTVHVNHCSKGESFGRAPEARDCKEQYNKNF